jgi:two-component system, NarL family, invasion response regulator UvrY
MELLQAAGIARGWNVASVSADVEKAMAKHSAKTTALAKSLSTREYEILRMLTHGCDLPEIGERLGVRSKTLANHQSSIKKKLGAGSALQLIIVARQMGLN